MKQPNLTLPAEDIFLDLKRPLVFFDLETTGVDVAKDRIVEISATKIFPDGKKTELYHLINPGMPIPEGASNVHGITDDKVRDKPTFSQLASELATYFTNSDLGGFNLKRFDVPLLMQEFHRCKLYPVLLSDTKVIDAYTLFVKKVPRTLSGALMYYCGEEHTTAHSAQGDIMATMKVLKHQLLHHDDLQPSVDFLHDFTADGETVLDFSGKFAKNHKGQVVFTFGKHKNEVVDVVKHKGFLDWMCEDDRFPIDTIMVIHRMKRHHKWTQEFKHWLDQTQLMLDLNKAFALYQALLTDTAIEPFKLSTIEKGVEITANEFPALKLVNKDAKDLFLVLLKNHFNEMGGVEYIRGKYMEKE